MTSIQMGQVSIRLINYLAVHGPRTLDAIVAKFSGTTRIDMRQRIRNLAASWWLEGYKGEKGKTMWRVHPDAYAKFPGIGLQVPQAPSVARGRGRPRDEYEAPPTSVAQPRRMSVFEAPTLSGMNSAPARPGAMDFLSLPSHGFRC